VQEYYSHMLRLTNSLLEMLVLALGYSVDRLSALTAEPVMNLKLLHYPPHTSTDERQFGAGAHTDFGALTILLQQPGKDGLQVWYAAAEKWLSVPAVEDVFVVNMGDLIQKWTSGKYSSTLHRVRNVAGGDRYSVPCFYQGDLRATNPFTEGETGGETVETHIRKKFDQSYGLSK
jgi:isopenicillin N synthase-like dioxygenase